MAGGGAPILVEPKSKKKKKKKKNVPYIDIHGGKGPTPEEVRRIRTALWTQEEPSPNQTTRGGKRG
jgi:hypothetical protein